MAVRSASSGGSLGPRVRAILWERRNWDDTLRTELENLKGGLSAERAGFAAELAGACDAVIADRRSAAEAYLLAWKCDRSRLEFLSRARFLCRSVQEHTTVAKIAKLQWQQTKDPSFCLVEGLAWLDAGEHDLAVRPLMSAQKAFPEQEDVRLALAAAQREWGSARSLLETLETSAALEADRGHAAQKFLLAARIHSMLGDDAAGYQRLLESAFEADPTAESPYLLLEKELFDRGDVDGLLAIHEERADAASSALGEIEVYCRAGSDLVMQGLDPTTGARLLTLAIQRGLETQTHSSSHLATWELLEEYHRHAGTLEVFVQLAAKALPDTDNPDLQVWLAMHILDIGWGELQKASAAVGAAVLEKLAPNHIALKDFRESGGDAAVQLSALKQHGPQEALLLELDPEEPEEALSPELHHEESDDDGLEILDLEIEVEPPPVRPIAVPATPRAVRARTEPGSPQPDRPTTKPASRPSPPQSTPMTVPKPAINTASLIPLSARQALSDLSSANQKGGAERRGSSRFNLSANLAFKVMGTRDLHHAATRDLSETGFFLLTTLELDTGTIIDVELSLPKVGNPWAVDVYSCRGRVTRKAADHGYGVQLLDPPQALNQHLQALTPKT